MKLNWGTSIAIFYSAFVIVMVLMVIKSSQNQMHLVQDNYYDKDMNYESFRSKRANSAEVADQISVKFSTTTDEVQFSFPVEMKDVKGTITFFRPSNKYLDKVFTLKLNEEGKMNIKSGRDLPSGLWKIKIDWEEGGKSYYKESTLVL